MSATPTAQVSVQDYNPAAEPDITAINAALTTIAADRAAAVTERAAIVSEGTAGTGTAADLVARLAAVNQSDLASNMAEIAVLDLLEIEESRDEHHRLELGLPSLDPKTYYGREQISRRAYLERAITAALT